MKRILTVPAVPAPLLDVRDLQVVMALATAGSTTSAASSLHITQSAVSRALSVAEEKVGTRLFERTARGLSPTAAGSRLLAGAGSILAQLTELQQQVASPDTRPLRVRLVCECYTAYRWLPSTLLRLRQDLPKLEVLLEVDRTEDPIEALRAGKVDIALLTTGVLPASRGARAALHEEPLFADEVVFVVSSTHPLAHRKSITPADVAASTIITSNTPPAEARWFYSRVFGRSKPPIDVLRFPLTEAILDAARANMGIAVLSEWIASSYLGAGDLVVKRLASGPLRRPWRIAYRAELADAARRLKSTLETSAPRLPVRAA
ncbi:MAG: LysR family transcriptional regulator [Polyangiaceae bacterium]|nr:LysR family transcriptional regulator [Polyangiaceae bacterium]